MKKTSDLATTLPNPRMLSCIYFTLLAILATIALNHLVYFLGMPQIIHFYQAMMLSVSLGALFGALFGERIVHAKKPYQHQVFWLGFEMVFSALPFYALGFMWFWLKNDHILALYTIGIWEYLKLYGFILFYCAILSTIWMAIASGFAAIYLRNCIVYYILQTKTLKREPVRHRHAH